MEKAVRHAWLRALGQQELPEQITLADGVYRRERTYKHDFFAATGLYCGPSGKVILKIGRVAPLAGLPMAWLGKLLAEHELAIYTAVQDLPGVPRCLGRYGATGFAHAFIEGHPLQRQEWVPDGFFPQLRALIEALHARGIAYVDLEKRENILVGSDGRPYLIDFQISWQWPTVGQIKTCPTTLRRSTLQRLVPDDLGRFILARLQHGDRYHLLKHCRRHRPDTLSAAEIAASYRRGPLIELHRRVSMPLTGLRRLMLKLLTGRSRSPKQDGPEFAS